MSKSTEECTNSVIKMSIIYHLGELPISSDREAMKGYILCNRSMPIIWVNLSSRNAFVRSGPVIFPQPAKGMTSAVILSCDCISEAKETMRFAASRGVAAPLAKSDTSSSDTTEDTPSDMRVICEYSGPAEGYQNRAWMISMSWLR
jgi:hypothetical protein